MNTYNHHCEAVSYSNVNLVSCLLDAKLFDRCLLRQEWGTFRNGK